MGENNNTMAEKMRSYLASQPKLNVSDSDRKCYKKELCKALEAADEIISNLYHQMQDDPTWLEAGNLIQDLIMRLDKETEQQKQI